jgi:2-polyprenyl-3-methyl-5-hydroxy-6-metoxy-1,4-benzoquinol methylase
MRNSTVRRIVASYDDPVVRAYCRVRFGILHQRFLDEIGQYLPQSGPILDVGCGFGLFSLYYAATAPGRVMRGFDLNQNRIAMARKAAARLGIGNVIYDHGDARRFESKQAVAAYMLDIIHHIPEESVPPLLASLRQSLPAGGTLLVKDVDTRPAAKRWFTWALDKAMGPMDPVRYWSAEELSGALESAGFNVRRHLMVDALPYPHILYICQAR